MSTTTIPEHHKKRLQAHFGFTKIPFKKGMWASEMFDSRSQRELHHGLQLWNEVHGFALVTGASGVGKSITVRRFAGELDEARFTVVHLTGVPSTPTGFLRMLNRALGLPMRTHGIDLFEQAQKHLSKHAEDRGPHPVLILDDAEGLAVETLDIVRRLTAHAIDAEDRFSVLMSGTEDLLRTLRDPLLDPLRSRIAYAQPLRAFTLEDTRNYILFQLKRAGGNPKLFSDDATRRIFQASQGRPRSINQLGVQALIYATVVGLDEITGDFMTAQIAAHPLFENPGNTP
jgi:type II secretory pathway predicted ATPase ExeA